ncbi:BNR-4 repeat-containing protein [Persicobacter psychrovividus]|uniref:BNR repeat-containing family member n=1 Tax=Persicobacter psychrovividus TaxID=387638 RepID=A0ABN6LGQ7_9BACT|nr:hypothetical protein PEPS_46280 [Persicobacter psychrovividus]
MLKFDKILLFVFLLLSQNTIAQSINNLTTDGAWCWFSAPRAIYRHSNGHEIATGWVTKDGSIVSGVLNLDSKRLMTQNVSPQLDKDDHANPCFIELQNKEVLMGYTKHFDKYVRIEAMPAGKDKQYERRNYKEVFNQKQFEQYPRKCVTYANLIQLKKENGRLFCFGRWTGYKPNMMWSDNNGKTFNDAQVFLTNKPFNDDNRPYVRYYSDGKSRIHIVFTDGHPRKEKFNSVYYAYYEKGAFYRVNGEKICDLDQIPFEPKEASLVYDAQKVGNGRAWVQDITSDKKGRPVILYSRYPNEQTHLYHYTKYDGKKWIDHLIVNSGKWFPQTPKGRHEREPHYSGGMTFHSHKDNVIYLSRQINGVFEIEKRITDDKGKTWEVFPITQHSKLDNVRPVCPHNYKKGDKNVVFWMTNEKYIHYTDFNTQINYTID